LTTNPDRIIRHAVLRCRQCSHSLKEAAVHGEERRQVFDIPPEKLEVTEHRAEIKICPYCGARNKADFPEDVTQTVGYGPEFKARVAYLKDYQYVAVQRVCQLMGDFYGHRPSEEMVLGIGLEGAEKVKPVREAVREYLKDREPVTHDDETGLRIEGKTCWLHTVSSKFLTYYGVHACRGREAMDDMGILGFRYGS
jgi:transposase